MLEEKLLTFFYSKIVIAIAVTVEIIIRRNCADLECALIKSFYDVHLLENKPKKELIGMLQQMGYDSDPVKAWKQAQEKVGDFESSGFQNAILSLH